MPTDDAVVVSPTSSDGEVVNPPFKIDLPPPVEAATAAAMAAVQEWWKAIEPLLRQLQAQVMLQLEPLMKASAEGFQRLELELQPHTQQAMAVLNAWKDKLEPHTVAVLASVQAATEAVRVKAYEPALAAVIAATAALQAHAATAAVFVQQRSIEGAAASKEWLVAQQPVLIEAQKVAMAHAAASLAALQAWQKQLEPLAREQMLKYGELAQVQYKALSEKAAVEYKEKVEPHVAAAAENVKQNLEKNELYMKVAPHVVSATVAIQENSAKAWEAAQPHLATIKAQLEVWAKQAEPHVAAGCESLKVWFLQTADCMCAPFAKAIKFGAADGKDYPPAAETAPAAASS